MSYYNEIIVLSSCSKGMAIEKSIQNEPVYLSLKKFGMEFKANAISIDTDAYTHLKTMITNPKILKFDPLFSH